MTDPTDRVSVKPRPIQSYILGEFARLARDLNDRMRAMGSPPSGGDLLGQVLAVNDRQIDVLESARPAVEEAAASDPARAEELFWDAIDRVHQIGQDGDHWAKDFGLSFC